MLGHPNVTNEATAKFREMLSKMQKLGHANRTGKAAARKGTGKCGKCSEHKHVMEACPAAATGKAFQATENAMDELDDPTWPEM